MVGAQEKGVLFPKLLLVPMQYHQTQKLLQAGLKIGKDTEVVDLRTRGLVVSQDGKGVEDLTAEAWVDPLGKGLGEGV